MKKKIVICPGCNHFYARHIKNVEGDVICLDVHHFISDRGVVGLRSSIGWDCFNGKRVRADSKSFWVMAARSFFSKVFNVAFVVALRLFLLRDCRARF